MALCYELAIVKLVQGKAEESLQLALEYPNNVQSSVIWKDYLDGISHLIISGSYGRLSQFSLAQ